MTGNLKTFNYEIKNFDPEGVPEIKLQKSYNTYRVHEPNTNKQIKHSQNYFVSNAGGGAISTRFIHSLAGLCPRCKFSDFVLDNHETKKK